MIVQGAGCHLQLGGQSAHRQIRQTVGCQHLVGGVKNLIARKSHTQYSTGPTPAVEANHSRLKVVFAK